MCIKTDQVHCTMASHYFSMIPSPRAKISSRMVNPFNADPGRQTPAPSPTVALPLVVDPSDLRGLLHQTINPECYYHDSGGSGVVEGMVTSVGTPQGLNVINRSSKCGSDFAICLLKVDFL